MNFRFLCTCLPFSVSSFGVLSNAPLWHPCRAYRYFPLFCRRARQGIVSRHSGRKEKIAKEEEKGNHDEMGGCARYPKRYPSAMCRPPLLSSTAEARIRSLHGGWGWWQYHHVLLPLRYPAGVLPCASHTRYRCSSTTSIGPTHETNVGSTTESGCTSYSPALPPRLCGSSQEAVPSACTDVARPSVETLLENQWKEEAVNEYRFFSSSSSTCLTSSQPSKEAMETGSSRHWSRKLSSSVVSRGKGWQERGPRDHGDTRGEGKAGPSSSFASNRGQDRYDRQRWRRRRGASERDGGEGGRPRQGRQEARSVSRGHAMRKESERRFPPSTPVTSEKGKDVSSPSGVRPPSSVTPPTPSSPSTTPRGPSSSRSSSSPHPALVAPPENRSREKREDDDKRASPSLPPPRRGDACARGRMDTTPATTGRSSTSATMTVTSSLSSASTPPLPDAAQRGEGVHTTTTTTSGATATVSPPQQRSGTTAAFTPSSLRPLEEMRRQDRLHAILFEHIPFRHGITVAALARALPDWVMEHAFPQGLLQYLKAFPQYFLLTPIPSPAPSHSAAGSGKSGGLLVKRFLQLRNEVVKSSSSSSSHHLTGGAGGNSHATEAQKAEGGGRGARQGSPTNALDGRLSGVGAVTGVIIPFDYLWDVFQLHLSPPFSPSSSGSHGTVDVSWRYQEALVEYFLNSICRCATRLQLFTLIERVRLPDVILPAAATTTQAENKSARAHQKEEWESAKWWCQPRNEKETLLAFRWLEEALVPDHGEGLPSTSTAAGKVTVKTSTMMRDGLLPYLTHHYHSYAATASMAEKEDQKAAPLQVDDPREPATSTEVTWTSLDGLPPVGGPEGEWVRTMPLFSSLPSHRALPPSPSASDAWRETTTSAEVPALSSVVYRHHFYLRPHTKPLHAVVETVILAARRRKPNPSSHPPPATTPPTATTSTSSRNRSAVVPPLSTSLHAEVAQAAVKWMQKEKDRAEPVLDYEAYRLAAYLSPTAYTMFQDLSNSLPSSSAVVSETCGSPSPSREASNDAAFALTTVLKTCTKPIACTLAVFTALQVHGDVPYTRFRPEAKCPPARIRSMFQWKTEEDTPCKGTSARLLRVSEVNPETTLSSFLFCPLQDGEHGSTRRTSCASVAEGEHGEEKPRILDKSEDLYTTAHAWTEDSGWVVGVRFALDEEACLPVDCARPWDDLQKELSAVHQELKDVRRLRRCGAFQRRLFLTNRRRHLIGCTNIVGDAVKYSVYHPDVLAYYLFDRLPYPSTSPSPSVEEKKEAPHHARRAGEENGEGSQERERGDEDAAFVSNAWKAVFPYANLAGLLPPPLDRRALVSVSLLRAYPHLFVFFLLQGQRVIVRRDVYDAVRQARQQQHVADEREGKEHEMHRGGTPTSSSTFATSATSASGSRPTRTVMGRARRKKLEKELGWMKEGEEKEVGSDEDRYDNEEEDVVRQAYASNATPEELAPLLFDPAYRIRSSEELVQHLCFILASRRHRRRRYPGTYPASLESLREMMPKNFSALLRRYGPSAPSPSSQGSPTTTTTPSAHSRVPVAVPRSVSSASRAKVEEKDGNVVSVDNHMRAPTPGSTPSPTTSSPRRLSRKKQTWAELSMSVGQPPSKADDPHFLRFLRHYPHVFVVHHDTYVELTHTLDMKDVVLKEEDDDVEEGSLFSSSSTPSSSSLSEVPMTYHTLLPSPPPLPSSSAGVCTFAEGGRTRGKKASGDREEGKRGEEDDGHAEEILE